MKSQLKWVPAVALLASALALPGSPAQAKAPAIASVYVIQALPGATVSVAVDGKVESADVELKGIVPVNLAPGKHTLTFRSANPKFTLTTDVTVAANESKDVVLHRPAAVTGDPVVTVYDNPVAPVAAEEGRVFVAHTAVVPPADITVNGDVLFANVANGEFAEADVPGGTYEVAIVPTGTTADPVLGPVDLTVDTKTLTQVFAVGRPQNGSMDVIVNKLPLQTAGSGAPTKIDTGSAGLVADWPVPAAETPTNDDTQLPLPALLLWLSGAALIIGLCARPTAQQLSRRARARRTRGT